MHVALIYMVTDRLNNACLNGGCTTSKQHATRLSGMNYLLSTNHYVVSQISEYDQTPDPDVSTQAW